MKRFLAGLLSLAVALVALEAMCRIGYTALSDATSPDPSREQWYAFSPVLGWTGKPGYRGRVLSREGSEREFDSAGFVKGELEKFEKRGKTKILFVGDSNTFGFDIPKSKSFPAHMEHLVANAVSINLSLAAYSSYQGRLVVHDVLQRFKPDILVVSFNYNDRRHVLRREDQDGPVAFEQRFKEFQKYERERPFEFAYTYRAVRFVLRTVGLYSDSPLDVNELPIDSLVPRVSPDNYRKNLEAMIEDARAHRVIPILLLFGDNPIQTTYLKKGIALYNAGKLEEAVELLHLAVVHRTTSSLFAQKLLVHAYALLGKNDVANHYARVIPRRFYNGGDEIEVDTLYQDIMSDVARRHGVELVDAKAVLDAEPAVYFDSCHFDEKGHRTVAELLASHITRLLKQQTGND